jgi:hypothetical protein
LTKPKNIHRGSSLTGFIRKEGIYEEVEAAALKKVIAAALPKQMDRRGTRRVASAVGCAILSGGRGRRAHTSVSESKH